VSEFLNGPQAKIQGEKPFREKKVKGRKTLKLDALLWGGPKAQKKEEEK